MSGQANKQGKVVFWGHSKRGQNTKYFRHATDYMFAELEKILHLYNQFYLTTSNVLGQ